MYLMAPNQSKWRLKLIGCITFFFFIGTIKMISIDALFPCIDSQLYLVF